MHPEGIDAAQRVAERFGELALETAHAMRTSQQVTMVDVRRACEELLVQQPTWKPRGDVEATSTTVVQAFYEAWHGDDAEIVKAPIAQDMVRMGVPVIKREDREDAQGVQRVSQSRKGNVSVDDEARLFLWELQGAILRSIHSALAWYKQRLHMLRKNGTTDLYALADTVSVDVAQLLTNTRTMLQVAFNNAERLHSVGTQMEQQPVSFEIVGNSSRAMRQFGGEKPGEKK